MQIRDSLEVLGTLALVLTIFYGLFDLRVNIIKNRQGKAPGTGLLISARTLVFAILTVVFFVAAILAAYTIGGS